MAAIMYDGFRHLDNEISDVGFYSEGIELPYDKYRAKITKADGSTRWVTGSTMQAFAENAYNIGFNESHLPIVPTFRAYSDKILETYKKPALKENSYIGYLSLCRQHLYPFFGDMLINRITYNDVQVYINTKAHLSKKTIEEHLDYLGMIFSYAIEEEIISKNPAVNKMLVNPSKKVEERGCLEADELRDIYGNLSKLRPEDASLVAFYMFTGMRRGELLGLTRGNIDNDFISIVQTITFAARNQPTVDNEGKTENALRIIPVLDCLRDFIPYCGDDIYVAGQCEHPFSNMKNRRTWERIAKTIVMHNATPQVFRHTFTTVCNNAAVDLKSIKLILGHSTKYDITLGRYTHGMIPQLIEAGKKINDEFVKIFNREGAYANQNKLNYM